MRKWFLLLAFLLLAQPLQAQFAGAGELTFTFEDIERNYTLYLPDDLPDSAPLVVVLHPRFSTGGDIEAYTSFNTLADTEKFIVLYPDGLEGEWNFVRGIPGYPNTHDDTGFLVALVEHVAATHPVDPSRVYVTGFSNGGFMAQRVACENPGSFAAYASVAAAGFGGMPSVCAGDGPQVAPMLLMHGTADDNIPWEGTPVTQGGQTIYVTFPVPETLGFWAAFNGCDAAAETTEIPTETEDAETQVRILTVDCPADTGVVLYAIMGGGHVWPGQRPGTISPLAGAINQDIDAAEEIWKFFAQHQRAVPAE